MGGQYKRTGLVKITAANAAACSAYDIPNAESETAATRPSFSCAMKRSKTTICTNKKHDTVTRAEVSLSPSARNPAIPTITWLRRGETRNQHRSLRFSEMPWRRPTYSPIAPTHATIKTYQWVSRVRLDQKASSNMNWDETRDTANFLGLIATSVQFADSISVCISPTPPTGLYHPCPYPTMC